MWFNYPVLTRSFILKLYYLSEISYYLSMIVVVISEVFEYNI